MSGDHPRHTVSSGNLTCRQPTHTPTRSASSSHKHSSALVHACQITTPGAALVPLTTTRENTVRGAEELEIGAGGSPQDAARSLRHAGPSPPLLLLERQGAPSPPEHRKAVQEPPLPCLLRAVPPARAPGAAPGPPFPQPPPPPARPVPSHHTRVTSSAQAGRSSSMAPVTPLSEGTSRR